jgi:outer membrane protein assembly factor BamA
MIAVDLSSSLRAKPSLRAKRSNLIIATLLLCSNFTFAASPSDSLATQIFANKKLIVKNIYANPEQQAWLNEAGINLKRYAGKPANRSMMDGILKKFIAYNENNGYPFARAQLDSVQMDSVFFSAALKLEKGSYISIDTLLVKGDGRVRPRFMQNHLGLRKPRPYSERYVQSIDKRVNELEFLSTLQPSALNFGTHKAELYAFVSNAKANRANGLLAFGYDENEQLQLQGEANIFIANMFKGGEELAVEWSSPDKNVQMLTVGVALPYSILGVIGINTLFNMERRDTLYLSLHGKVGLSSRVGSYSAASLFIDAQRHNNTAANVQITSVLYGADYTLRNVDNPLFPRSGIHAYLSIAAGTRKAENGSSSTNVESMANVAFYAAVSNRISLMLRAQGKVKGNFGGDEEIPLYQSELYSIGGANSLRGFNERSIFTSAYAIATVEPQFYFSTQGYLSAFCDYAPMKNGNFPHATDHLLTFGLGTRFTTGMGIFSLSYALGKVNGDSFLFKNAKVHVGYTVVF